MFRNSHLSVIYKTEEPREEEEGDVEPGVTTETRTEGTANEETPSPTAITRAALFTLVTDQVFLNEPSIVWERLADVDGSSSSWVDADFRRASPAGGDFAGQTAEDALIAAQIAAGIIDPSECVFLIYYYPFLFLFTRLDSHELALQLQAEEEENARRSYERRVRHAEQQQRQQQQQQYQVVEQGRAELEKLAKRKKKKPGCIIM